MVLSYGKIIEPPDEDNEDENAPQDSDFVRIVKLSIKTFFWSVALLSLIFALYVTFFPFKTIKFYTNSGLDVRALEVSEIYVNRNKSEFSEQNQPEHNSKFATALLSCVNLSISLMEDSVTQNGFDSQTTKFYAEKAEKYIGMYQSFSTLLTRNELIDEYYRANSAPSMHADLYSFEDYLNRKAVRAMGILGKDAEIFALINSEIDLLFPEAKEDSILRYSLAFNRLTAYLNFIEDITGLSKISTNSGFIDANKALEANLPLTSASFSILFNDKPYRIGDNVYDAGITPILDRLEKNIDSYKNYCLSQSDGRDINKTLTHLFYSKSVADLLLTMRNVTVLMYFYGNIYNQSYRTEVAALYNVWEAKVMISPSRSIYDWYKKDAVTKYVAMYS